MRVYFLSYISAVLKLNGLYVGTVDGFERHIELDPKDKVFAEFIPDNNLQSVNFFIDEKFFNCPPAFADVYLMDGDALIYIREYGAKNVQLNVIFQTRFCGNLITVFSQGGIYLSLEGMEYTLTPLPLSFCGIHAEEKVVAGRSVLALYGGKQLILISEQGRTVFMNPAENAEFGDTLKITTAFETCTAAKAECEFSYDGEKMTLISSKTVETIAPDKSVLHFAFFESVLTCSDFEKYLDEDLKQKAADLKSYLGEFVSVTIPPEKFYLTHGNIAAVGLVYPKSKNLYEVKYFAVDFNGEKISNIYPVN